MTPRPLLNYHPTRGALIGWVTITALLTAVLSGIRTNLDKSHIALAYLLLVLIGTSRLGRRGGIALAVVCFFAFNFFLLPPYHRFTIADDRDWFVLLAFLLTSLVAAQLLSRAQAEAETARLRTSEVDRLSTLGAETLSAGRAEEALTAIAGVIQTTLRFESCEIFLAEAEPGSFRRVAFSGEVRTNGSTESSTTSVFDYLVQNSAVGIVRVDSTVHVIRPFGGDIWETIWTQPDAKAVAIPLTVHDQNVGILRVTGHERVYLDPEQRRFAHALSYYAALGVERVRLMSEAERTEALQAASKLKDSFVAAVSHDLRTPLTTIKGLAHEMGFEDERARLIEREADRLNQLVEDVLDLSKLNSGSIDINRELNAVEDLIGAALAQVRGLPRSEDITVSIPAGEVVVARFDFVQSLRCLVNLLENALKYSPPGTMIEVGVDETEREVKITVADRGRGIDANMSETVFDAFVRGDKATAGSGLGLAIARRIAVAQGGGLRYAPRPGGGSVFTFSVPSINT